jgi:ribose 5-phosphate isomerase B
MDAKTADIALGSDHAGFSVKQDVGATLQEEGMRVLDFGATSDQSTDYPIYAHAVAQAVSSKTCRYGILVCGTGQGMAMTCNKYKHIRAALCWSVEIAKLAREHNDANILCLPGQLLNCEEALAIVQVFLSTPFSGGRHLKRVLGMTQELK